MSILYAGGSDHIITLDLSGRDFREVDRLNVGEVPSFLAFAPDGKSALAVVEGGDRLAHLGRNAQGQLSLLGSVECGGGPAFVSYHPFRPLAFTASYGSGEVRSYAVSSSKLESAASTLVAGKWAHAARVGCDGLLYVPCKGTDRIELFQDDPETGSLKPIHTLSLSAGRGPRHMEFSSDGRRIFVVHEISVTTQVIEKVEEQPLATAFRVHAEVSHFDGAPQNTDSGADIHLSPDERFLYVSSRGHDSLTVFAVEGTTLTRIQTVSSGGQVPRNFSLLGNDLLLAANQESREIVLFERDPASGKLTEGRRIQLDQRIYWVGPAAPARAAGR